jgi:hypothetical protein
MCSVGSAPLYGQVITLERDGKILTEAVQIQTASPQPPPGGPGQPQPGQPAPAQPMPTGEMPPATPGATPAANTTTARPNAPTYQVNPEELKIVPDADGNIQFSFNGQPWPDVLEWFARINAFQRDEGILQPTPLIHHEITKESPTSSIGNTPTVGWIGKRDEVKAFGFRHGTIECDRTFNRPSVPHLDHIVSNCGNSPGHHKRRNNRHSNPASSYHSHPLPFTPALNLSKDFTIDTSRLLQFQSRFDIDGFTQ